MRLSPCRYNHANLFWLSEEDVGGNRRSGGGWKGQAKRECGKEEVWGVERRGRNGRGERRGRRKGDERIEGKER